MPDLYQIHIFAMADGFLEQQPILYQKEKMKNCAWYRSYQGGGQWFFDIQEKNIISGTKKEGSHLMTYVRELRDQSGGRLGVIEVSMRMADIFPEIDVYKRQVMNPTDGEQAMVDQDALKEYQWSNADVEGAKKLLDDAGIVDTDGDGIREYNGKNLSYKAECPTGWSDWNATLEIVAAAGKNIGINIETYFPEAANYNTDYSTGNFEITKMCIRDRCRI